MESVGFQGVIPCCYAGMPQNDGDLELPKRFLVHPPIIRDTMSESSSNEWRRPVRVLGDVVPVEQRPWLKAAEITNAMIEAIRSGQYKVLRCNYAKGDMVRHVGHFHPATTTIVAVDLALSRLMPVP